MKVETLAASNALQTDCFEFTPYICTDEHVCDVAYTTMRPGSIE